MRLYSVQIAGCLELKSYILTGTNDMIVDKRKKISHTNNNNTAMKRKNIDYTKEFIIVTKKFYQVTAKSNDILDRIKEAIREINDKNVLHCQEMTLSFKVIGFADERIPELPSDLKNPDISGTRPVQNLINKVKNLF